MSANQGSMRGRRVRAVVRVAGATVSAATIVVLVVACALLPVWGWVDGASHDARMPQTVSQNRLTAYCPARMSLADTGAYGDGEFRASPGDLASSARYAAFGSVYMSTVSPLGSADDTSLTLGDSDGLDGADAMVASGSADNGSMLMDTRLLEAESGTGAAASVASWASVGDLRGVSASECVAPALEHAFLLPGSGTGTVHQLVVANPSSKATSVRLRVWGATSGGEVALSTGSAVSVPARGESVVDLSAAAPGQDGLYMTLSSEDTPVGAVVRTVSMDGLTPKGSDFSTPLPSAARSSSIVGVRQGDALKVSLFAERESRVSVLWMGEKGTVRAAQSTVPAGRVVVVSPGEVPQGTHALLVRSDEDVSAMARIVRSGKDGQEDFAMSAAQTGAVSSAAALPEGLQATLVLSNPSSRQGTAMLHVYDAQGKALSSERIMLEDGSATEIRLADVYKDAAAVMLDANTSLVWGMRVERSSVTDAQMAGVAYVRPTALEPRSDVVWAQEDQTIVR